MLKKILAEIQNDYDFITVSSLIFIILQYAGWLALLIGVVGMSIEFANTNLDSKGLMEANSVLWLGVFYGYSIRLILTSYKN